MYAVVEISGTQFEIEPDMKLRVPLLNGNPGDEVEFGNILLAKDGGETMVGTPYIDGNVKAKILDHGKDKKVIVFKKKRRKGYRVLKGHRQNFTTIEITDINLS